MSLIDAFWAASQPSHRRLILDEAAGRSTGVTSFSFDTLDVELDFDAHTGTVFDVLDSGQHEVTALSEFLARADSFGDHDSIGDRLTATERRPPTFKADRRGGVERT